MALFTGSGGTLEAVALSTECTVEINQSMVETTSALSGRARSFRPGRYGWVLRTTSLLAADASNATALTDALLTGSALPVAVARCELEGSALVPAQGGWSLAGTAYVESLEVTGEVRGMTRFRASLRGSGVLTRTPEDNS